MNGEQKVLYNTRLTGAERRGRLLDMEDLSVSFFTARGEAKVLKDVSFHLNQNETLGLVGESGCGKTMTVLAALRLIPPGGKITQGQIRLNGQNLLSLSETEMREVRGRKIGMIFQEPMSSLNPTLAVGDQIEEALLWHTDLSRKKMRARCIELLMAVGIGEPERRRRDFPHQFSGGERQRVMIAIALACGPKILIADEPTTALDVTVQAQIIELLKTLKKKEAVSIILITHNLGVIANFSERVIILYAGEIVEEAKAAALFKEPLHPYTLGLMRSIPSLSSDRKKRLPTIEGNVPQADSLPSGCPFHPRCSFAQAKCSQEKPPLEEARIGRKVACFFWKEISVAS